MTEARIFCARAAGYNRIPVLAEARADLYTPLAVYLKLAGGPEAVLQLPARVGGRRRALRPLLVRRPCLRRAHRSTAGRRLRRLLRDARGADVCLEELEGDPFDYVRAWLKRHRAAPLPAALRFAGGLVGYFGYETVRTSRRDA